MEKEKIIQVVENIFTGADRHDWPKVQYAMDEKIFVDYSSLSGSPAATILSAELIGNWKDFLPRFDHTHHHLFDFQVNQKETEAEIHCFGKAEHFLNNAIWIVEGTYDLKVLKVNADWLVSSLVFNLTKESGNTDLPMLAMKR